MCYLQQKLDKDRIDVVSINISKNIFQEIRFDSYFVILKDYVTWRCITTVSRGVVYVTRYNVLSKIQNSYIKIPKQKTTNTFTTYRKSITQEILIILKLLLYTGEIFW